MNFESQYYLFLASPGGAVGWALTFICMGISIDLVNWVFPPRRYPNKRVFFALFLFSGLALSGVIIILGTLYPAPQYLGNFLEFGYFLIPFAIVEGIFGGYVGYILAVSGEQKDTSISQEINRHAWYRPWTKHVIVWVFLGTVSISWILGAFTFFFDVYFFHIGYIFIYYFLPYAGLITYFLKARLRVWGIGIVIFGINGCIGIPIDLYFEWFQAQSLVSPWGAVWWAIIYVLYGLSLDLSFWVFNPQKGEPQAASKSALIFSIVTIALSILATTMLYKNLLPVPGIPNMLTYTPFLITSTAIATVLMAFLGTNTAKKN